MIKIIKGTFGYNDGKAIKPVTAKDGPISVDAATEARLVAKGIAEYVQTGDGEQNVSSPDDSQKGTGTSGGADTGDNSGTSTATDPNGSQELYLLPEYNENMKLAELKEIAAAYGVDASKALSKAKVIEMIEEAIADSEDETEPELDANMPVVE